MKRLFDLLIGLAILVTLLPILIAIAFLVWFKLGSPIFFRQVRPGLNGIPFVMVKFRTMHDALDDQGNLLPDGLRLTSFGRWLRATSFDELPELWNVIKGEMSIVGPRPLLIEYLSIYSYEQARRHEVRPGITGWAQINGRNSIMWAEKFELDLWYVDNRSLWLDVKILIITIYKVLFKKDVKAGGGEEIEYFNGKN
jgi:lipopolysaccharide/colanic/teichoic acid biosynthesis glycosyltransferase